MIKVEGYHAFNGTMRITPKSAAPFELTGDWLYKPDTKCWYGQGRSFGGEVCEVVDDSAAALRRTAEDDKAMEEGRSEKLALAMRAGARAIDQSKRLSGATYCYDVFGERGEPKEISYYEAANILRQEAEAALKGE